MAIMTDRTRWTAQTGRGMIFPVSPDSGHADVWPLNKYSTTPVRSRKGRGLVETHTPLYKLIPETVWRAGRESSECSTDSTTPPSKNQLFSALLYQGSFVVPGKPAQSHNELLYLLAFRNCSTVAKCM